LQSTSNATETTTLLPLPGPKLNKKTAKKIAAGQLALENGQVYDMSLWKAIWQTCCRQWLFAVAIMVTARWWDAVICLKVLISRNSTGIGSTHHSENHTRATQSICMEAGKGKRRTHTPKIHLAWFIPFCLFICYAPIAQYFAYAGETKSFYHGVCHQSCSKHHLNHFQTC
jgi:hypothetical protein